MQREDCDRVSTEEYDQEFRDRVVRMYGDRLAEPGRSKLGARRHVGSLLDVKQATLRNWVEDAERADGQRGAAASRNSDSDEVRALKRRVAELEGTNEILKTGTYQETETDAPRLSQDQDRPRIASAVSRSCSR